MKEVFKERLDNRIEVFILFGCLTFMWLLSDNPWISIIVGLIIYLWFGAKYYYLEFDDHQVKVVYPLMKKKNISYSVDEIEAVYHLILYNTKRRSDLIRVNTNSKEYKISIEREPEDFRKVNTLIHHEKWGVKLKTKGDATNIKEIIKRREEGWTK